MIFMNFQYINLYTYDSHIHFTFVMPIYATIRVYIRDKCFINRLVLITVPNFENRTVR